MLLSECAAGVIAAIWPRCLGLQSSRGGAVGALQTYYALPDFEHFTAAVDLAQTEVSYVRKNFIRSCELVALSPLTLFLLSLI